MMASLIRFQDIFVNATLEKKETFIVIYYSLVDRVNSFYLVINIPGVKTSQR